MRACWAATIYVASRRAANEISYNLMFNKFGLVVSAQARPNANIRNSYHDESTTAAKQKLNFGKEKVTIFRTGSPIIRHTANELGSLPKGSRTHPWLRGDTKPIRSLKFQTNTPNKRYDATTARTPSPQQRKWLIASVQNHRIVLTLVGQYIRWTANRD